MKYYFFILILVVISCTPMPDFMISKADPPINKTREAKMVSAFFGLDNALPPRAARLWVKAPGKDGMPVIFSHELDPGSLDASDFQVTTQNGEVLDVEHVTFRPAVEEFELRTLLFIGEFGNYPDNEPIEVEIIGELKTRDGQELLGQKIAVTPLAEGPFLSYAEYFEFDVQYPYVEAGRGCDCPKSSTKVVVRTVWAGGVRSIEGEELGDAELNHFHVLLKVENDTIEVNPYRIADVDDNDNNIDLCLKEEGIPISVRVDENIAIDPRDDKNPFTEIKILGRWK